MLRRSTRQKAQAQAIESPRAQTKSSRKRAKKAAEPVNESSETKPQRKRGKLRFITEVPLDVLFEIFVQLLPVDILNLSCASKALRDILLRRSAAFVWKQTFLNVPYPTPPPCPADLNEAQYANLLWRKHCFFSGLAAFEPAKIIYFIGQPYFLYATEYFWRGKNLVPQLMVLSSSLTSNERICLTSDLEAIQKRLDELDETNSDNQEFLRQCREIADMKLQHSILCSSWETQLKANRRDELKNAGESRKKAILAKLDELGWNTELSYHSTRNEFFALPVVRQNKELTERAWADMEPELVTFLTEAKKQRLFDVRATVLEGRFQVLFRAAKEGLEAIPWSVRPSTSDLCIMPEYRAILERASPGMTDEDFGAKKDSVTEEDFADALAHLFEQTDQWRKSNIDILLELLPSGSKHQGKKRLDTHTLDLCTTFFRCHSCREPISYPRILSHACLKKPRSLEEEETGGDLLEKLILPETPWIHGHKGIAFDDEASNIAGMLIRLCGQDPKTLTTTGMDEVDSRFECQRCVHPTKGILVMSWRIALLHELEDHYEETLEETSYRLLDLDEVTAAKEREAKSKRQGPPSLLCPKCYELGDDVSTQSEMQHHMSW
ncbi:hypothetical protein B0H12DRAFT_1241294 [Mycena haematopus]|nr:hypothetical protein B0H12DRAFT_1241294 [Mycena haematopus]